MNKAVLRWPWFFFLLSCAMPCCTFFLHTHTLTHSLTVLIKMHTVADAMLPYISLHFSFLVSRCIHTNTMSVNSHVHMCMEFYSAIKFILPTIEIYLYCVCGYAYCKCARSLVWWWWYFFFSHKNIILWIYSLYEIVTK